MTSRWFLIDKHYYNLDAFSEFKIGAISEGKYPVVGVLKTPRSKTESGNTLIVESVTLKKIKTKVEGFCLIVDILAGKYDVDVKSTQKTDRNEGS